MCKYSGVVFNYNIEASELSAVKGNIEVYWGRDLQYKCKSIVSKSFVQM